MIQQTKKKRSDAEQNKLNILTTVIDLSQQGIDISTMNISTIAEKSGVGVGTLYRHFHNKAALCVAMMDEQVTVMFKEIGKFLERHANASIYDKVFGILSIYLDLKEANLNTLAYIEKSGQKSNSIISIPFFEQLKAILRQQFEFENEDKDNIEFKLNLILNCFSSDFYHYMTKDEALTKAQFLHKVLDTIL